MHFTNRHKVNINIASSAVYNGGLMSLCHDNKKDMLNSWCMMFYIPVKGNCLLLHLPSPVLLDILINFFCQHASLCRYMMSTFIQKIQTLHSPKSLNFIRPPAYWSTVWQCHIVTFCHIKGTQRVT